MNDQTNPDDGAYGAPSTVGEYAEAAFAPLMPPAAYPEDIVTQAVANGIAACEPQWIGDHGLAIVRPEGWAVDTFDSRNFEDLPRHVELTQRFVAIQSLADYTALHADDTTRVYAIDTPGTLAADTKLVVVVLDDHPGAGGVNYRTHRAELVLRPTAAARRWAKVLGEGQVLTQEAMLDLIDDGIREIADPDGAVLRDLVADLHSVRSTEVQSVIRTGGEATVTLAENVGLRAGTGNKVTIPEALTVVLTPWTIPNCPSIAVKVKVKPKVRDKGILFELASADTDEALSDARAQIAAATGTDLERTALWVVSV